LGAALAILLPRSPPDAPPAGETSSEPPLSPVNAGDICLRLSENPFRDRPGACKLIEMAIGCGDQSMTQRLAECRAS
jgi:hypothetical protein